MSETIQYTPWGLANEGKKLYSQPVAALSIAQDNLRLLGEHFVAILLLVILMIYIIIQEAIQVKINL